ncbi:MAG: hypothetical protein HFE90_08010 [Firmicutes bacterium]|nr:hypothetical protein [Bacillota bacterium]
MKEISEEYGIVNRKTGSPKMIIKSAYIAGMIDDEDIWAEVLKTRNVLLNTYQRRRIVIRNRKDKIQIY